MRPFLKWPGNKYNIVEAIRGRLPAGNRLVEPFVGSGAVFLNTDYSRYLLNDNNPDLINLYKILQKEGEPFIQYCRTFFTPENNASDKYYEFRTLFNRTDDQRLKSALLIYLNRHGYNGLVRYNLHHELNVPFGDYKKPYFPYKELLFFYNKTKKAVFTCDDFSKTMAGARPGDVLYCDPPYVPLSITASFTTYSAGGFSLERQKELALMAEELSGRGIPVLVSNHDTDFTNRVYQNADIQRLLVQRLISCDGENRKKVGEVLALFAPREKVI
ncbi:MAG: Dam family site-specific DNA-(adenine-N6)-methyltransferase [Syntrophomonadaceae bacterium]